MIGSLYILLFTDTLLLLQISKNPQRVSGGMKWKLKGGYIIDLLAITVRGLHEPRNQNCLYFLSDPLLMI